MNVKTLIQQAVEASVSGDQQTAAELIKQSIQAKAKAIVENGGGYFVPPGGKPTYVKRQKPTDERYITVEEYELADGTLVNADLTIEITDYTAPSSGSFSQRAMDPEEYYGTEEDIEWDITGVTFVYDDGSTKDLSAAEVKSFQLTSQQYEWVTEQLLEEIRDAREASRADYYDRDYDY